MTRAKEIIYFTCGQETAKGIVQVMKHPCSGITEDCFVIHFFVLESIHPLMVWLVGLIWISCLRRNK